MKQPIDRSPSNPGSFSIQLAAASPAARLCGVLLLCGLGACGGGGAKGSSSGNQEFDSVAHVEPALAAKSKQFVVDTNRGGNATSVKLLGAKWGRLVDVYDGTATDDGELQQTDMVVGENIKTNDDYQLETNPVTARTTIRIKHAFGTSAYTAAFKALDQNLIPIQDKSLNPTELPPYSLVPRNAAILMQFDDLLSDSLISSDTIRVRTGNPPSVPFESRIIPDINHGDFVVDDSGGKHFHTTRVIIDTSVSVLEAQASNPPIGQNTLGLPASITSNQANIAIRIPTVTDVPSGQLVILRNLSGHPLGYFDNGSNDQQLTSGSLHTLTKDIVRALRSGGAQDIHNGFLLDQELPRVVGTQPVQISAPTIIAPGEFVTAVTFSFSTCAVALKKGSVIQQPGIFGEVTEDTDQPLGGVLSAVHYRIVFTTSPTNTNLVPGQAVLSIPFDPSVHSSKEACFVRFPQIGTPPDKDVNPESPDLVVVRFSEPMDPLSIKPFDSFMVNREGTGGTSSCTSLDTPDIPPDTNATGFIVGKIQRSADLREFTFRPSLPLKHTFQLNPTTQLPVNCERFFVRLGSGASGPTDLAGNALEDPLAAFRFRVAGAAATQSTAGLALRFSSSDEVSNPANGAGLGLPEVRGQFVIDPVKGVLKPRAVSRSAGVADRTRPVPGIMANYPPGVQTPLSGLGSKMQTIWRYCDVGFGLQDETFTNVDIEGLDWSPKGGSVVSETYARFSISLAHSLHLPDETFDNMALLLLYPNSGLSETYATNVLDSVHDPLKIVHPKDRGYSILPGDLFTADTGTKMMPFPLNRGIPKTDFKYYTWRDTALLALGAPPDSPGADLPILIQAQGAGTCCTFAPGAVPTIGLPLLMEFRCYPQDGSLGLNSFDVSLATNNSAKPNFRAYSTGGNVGSTIVKKEPDDPAQDVASGGFNPTSTPQPGAVTLPADNTFYIGQMDLVTRISRAHTIWFTQGSVPLTFVDPVVEPDPEDQPTGTQVVLAFRGASAVSGAVLTDANLVNQYGDPAGAAGGTVTFFPTTSDREWKASLNEIQGARLFQVRISFISNAATNLAPQLSALGFAFRF